MIDPVDKNSFPQHKTAASHHAVSAEDWRAHFNKFFHGAGLSQQQFTKLMMNIENMISAQIRQEQEQAKKTSEKLKRSELGEDY